MVASSFAETASLHHMVTTTTTTTALGNSNNNNNTDDAAYSTPFSGDGGRRRHLTSSIDIPKSEKRPRGLSFGKWVKQQVSNAFSSLGSSSSSSSQGRSSSAFIPRGSNSPALLAARAAAFKLRKSTGTASASHVRYYKSKNDSSSTERSNSIHVSSSTNKIVGRDYSSNDSKKAEQPELPGRTWSRGNTVQCCNCRKYFRACLSQYEEYCTLDCKSAHQLRRISHHHTSNDIYSPVQQQRKEKHRRERLSTNEAAVVAVGGQFDYVY